MSKLNDYYQKKQLLEKLSEQLNELEEDQGLKKDLEFENKVRKLMKEYDKDARNALNILAAIDPSIGTDGSVKNVRAPRPLVTYNNPHTGEVVKTRGGNHKTLKAWREKWGKEEVQNWAHK